jgi:hypothetical protein
LLALRRIPGRNLDPEAEMPPGISQSTKETSSVVFYNRTFRTSEELRLLGC